ncbi:MAG TPA: NADP-dependent malic enzyme [Chloroflexota bacterium]|nr:NADP-dependent malic enzyme [Chloroflexota bacterium]
MISEDDVLEYHGGERPGKLQITPTKPLLTQRDLSLAYTPGVAYAVDAIRRNPLLAYDYTAKGNLVAVVTNGTAVLGLGNQGPLAAKPVMEGKAVLFKRLADVDVFDIELDAPTAQDVITAVRTIAPGFGGINLEDIAAPAAFEVEEQLKATLSIPVFHDDQHGTAIVVAAALLNALELTGKDLHAIKIVVVGAGAAGVATARMFLHLGVPREHITMFDRVGEVVAGRAEEMDPWKERFAQPGPARSLGEALQSADVLLGVAAANIVTPDMLQAMAPRPILFLLANPEPEIAYDLAVASRPDAVVATGRSDHPNQVNNVLVFPYIFRGALDVQASAIDEAMMLAAAEALASLAKEPVPETVLRAYGLQHLRFGKDYIIPKPNDYRVLDWVAPAVAEAAIRSGVARRVIDIRDYRERLRIGYQRGWQIIHAIMEKAEAEPKRLVFAEGENPKILRAAGQIERQGLGRPILLGRPAAITRQLEELGSRATPQVIDPDASPWLPEFAEEIFRLRQRRGVTMHRAEEMARDPNIFGLMMLRTGRADGFLSGLSYEYPRVVRPILELIRTRPGVGTMAGAYLVLARGRAYFFADGLININPNAVDLAEIAILTADFARQLDIQPRVALISFSNFGSLRTPESEKVAQAVQIVRERRPDLEVDGEMQADTALDAAIAEEYYPFSRVAGANVLIFPNLDAANSSLKVLSQLGEMAVIGPILLGAAHPAQVLQHGSDLRDIVRMAALTTVEALSVEA